MPEIHHKLIEYFTNKDNPIILDLGCYLLEDGKEFNKLISNSTIYGFEADPRNCLLIKKDKEINNNIHLVEGAIGNIDGEIDFYPSETIDWTKKWHLSGSTHAPKDHLKEYTVSFGKSFKVKSQTLDTWYSNNLDGKNIELCYTDLNGGEWDFIQGAINTLQNHVNLLYIELFEQELYEGQKPRKFIEDQLKTIGFTFTGFEHGHNYLFKKS